VTERVLSVRRTAGGGYGKKGEHHGEDIKPAVCRLRQDADAPGNDPYGYFKRYQTEDHGEGELSRAAS